MRWVIMSLIVLAASLFAAPDAEAGPLRWVAGKVAGAVRKVGKVAAVPLRGAGRAFAGRANGCN